MRWRLGSVLFAAILVSLAISSPASGHHSCTHECFQFYQACKTACASDPECIASCSDQFEACRCGGCGICP